MDDGRLLAPAVLFKQIPTHGVGDGYDVGVGRREQAALEGHYQGVEQPDLPIGAAVALERVEPRAVADMRRHDVSAEGRKPLGMDEVEAAADGEGRWHDAS